MLISSSPLSAVSVAYLETLEERYKADPASIDPGWRHVFDVLRELEIAEGTRPAALAAMLAAAYRSYGHLRASLDPLRRTAPAPPEELSPERIAAAAARLAAMAERLGGEAALIDWLRQAYCGTLAVETTHIDDAGLRAWIHDAFENAPAPAMEARRRAFELLVSAEAFERFMGVKFPAKKRFGAEGAESLIPLLDRALRNAAASGVGEVVIGSMHRGRLNIAANIFGKPLVELLAEFKGAQPFVADPPVAADVPYHLGIETELAYDGRKLKVTLAPNPSHLEAVKPVVLGRVRARQNLAQDPRRALGILIHTDASVIAQGIVAETLQLSGVEGFTTAGTIHIVVNNQIGFTTDMDEARSSRTCTGAWKAVDSLILHANGDDPDAVLRAADLAASFQQAHGRDAVIDLVCYRRNGHNEIDEPRFTQPLAYRAIDAHPSVAALFGARLAEDSVMSAAEAEAAATRAHARLQEGYDGAAGHRANRSGFPGGLWAPHDPTAAKLEEPATGVEMERLQALLAAISAAPEGMAVDRKVERILRQRAQGAEAGIPWATAEALAFAALLAEGTPVRLSGQDVVRGAFSHRHLALTDTETGKRHVSLNHLGLPQARLEAINSPLSEYAVLGFEYGYSLERPDALVIWEAQFGDFANGAQIVIDQFVVSGEEKWRQPSGLVMLLPHGLEGQGPEHSSARIERFLQLAARDNVQIAHPSTPASYFHLLRRQIHRKTRKPLIVMSPKTLLRLPAAVSPLAALSTGNSFQPVLPSSRGGEIRRVLICSGKIAYELEREREQRKAEDVAIIRLEMLYPLPAQALSRLFAQWKEASFAWVQEEPENMGAWSYLDRRLEALLVQAGAAETRVSCIARPESPSPAGSFHSDHEQDQHKLVERAFI